MKKSLPTLVLLTLTSMVAMAGASLFKSVTKVVGHPTSLNAQNARKISVPAPTSRAKGLMPYQASTYDPRSVIAIEYAADQLQPIYINSNKVLSLNNSTIEQQAVVTNFLNDYKPLLGIKNPSAEFKVISSATDALGMTHIKLAQQYLGYEVEGKQLIVHTSSTGTIINGRWTATPTLPAPNTVVSSASSIATVLRDMSTTAESKEMTASTKALLHYSGPSAQLLVLPKSGKNSSDKWAYKVTSRPNFISLYEYYIDAITGAIIDKIDISCTVGAVTASLTDLNGTTQSLNTYQHTNGTYYMIDISRNMYNAGQSQMPDNPVGAIWTVDAQGASANNIQIAQLSSSDNSSYPSRATAASAHNNGSKAYEYYKNIHNRNSIDGNGGTIISVINVKDQSGNDMDNAFWNGQLMAYGNGNVAFKPLAGGLDVAGHEMTHGVIQATANLKYEGQSGALNESMADVFGAMIDKSNWTLGEQVVNTSYFPSGALRNLQDPHNGTTQGNNGWQPAKMSEFVNTTSDHGGVHTNSGVTNHAFYYFANAVTKATAEKVYYRALSNYLTSTSQFIDARVAVIQAAADLYGATSSEVAAAKTAFDNVEIYGGTSAPPVVTPSVNGSDYIFVQNTDFSSTTNALYFVKAVASPQAADEHAISTVQALNNASITDDGALAYYVGPDHNVYSITISTTNPVTTAITTSGDWDNVAVSRDGKRLALVSKYIDTSIYVYDITTQAATQFQLYNPTFTQGVSTNGPVYADALDWDLTGESVIYDEKNIINNTGSTTEISYWDIAIMKAWNRTANTAGTGEVSKLINNLPDGISLGNPVFAKNHGDVVAFDLITAGSSTFDIKGANISTGTIGTIYTGNLTLGVPSYSGADDKITFSGKDNNGVEVTAILPLTSDFINGTGTAAVFEGGSKWSVWFTQGTRANAQCAGVSATITALGSTAAPLTSVVLDAGTGATSYHWNTGATTQKITVTQKGNYQVTVVKSGCTIASQAIGVGYGTAVLDIESSAVLAYPNPTTELLTIHIGESSTYQLLSVYDLAGRLLHSQPITSAETTVDMSTIATGIYLVKLLNTSTGHDTIIRVVRD